MKVRYQFGRNTRRREYRIEGDPSTFIPSNRIATDQMAADMGRDLREAFGRRTLVPTKKKLESVKMRMSNAINGEIRTLSRFVNTLLIGRNYKGTNEKITALELLTGGSKIESGGDRLETSKLNVSGSSYIFWEKLYSKDRYKPGKRRSWFIKTGALQQFMKANLANTIRSKGGRSKVRIKTNPQALTDMEKGGRGRINAIVATMYISILPGLTGTGLPLFADDSTKWYHADGSLERRFFSDDVAEKLLGPIVKDGERRYRPILQPMIQFWVKYRIPARLRYFILNSGFKE